MIKTPTTAGTRANLVALRGRAGDLHRLWSARLLEPNDPGLLDAIWDLADALWIQALELGINPHRLCSDRYCDCHITLMLHEPPTLPGLEQTALW